jgi:hypothetical protein
MDPENELSRSLLDRKKIHENLSKDIALTPLETKVLLYGPCDDPREKIILASLDRLFMVRMRTKWDAQYRAHLIAKGERMKKMEEHPVRGYANMIIGCFLMVLIGGVLFPFAVLLYLKELTVFAVRVIWRAMCYPVSKLCPGPERKPENECIV